MLETIFVSNGKILTSRIYTKDRITKYTFSAKVHKAYVKPLSELTDKRQQNLSEMLYAQQPTLKTIHFENYEALIKQLPAVQLVAQFQLSYNIYLCDNSHSD